jgi:hypothetical protein
MLLLSMSADCFFVALVNQNSLSHGLANLQLEVELQKFSWKGYQQSFLVCVPSYELHGIEPSDLELT